MVFYSRKKLGAWGEQIAEATYFKRGYVLVARNIYNSRGKMLGEIDLVMRSDKLLIFVEVKVRRGTKFGSAVESISKLKAQRIIRTVAWFMRRYPVYAKLQPRIDVCAIDLDKTRINVTIIPSAVTLDN